VRVIPRYLDDGELAWLLAHADAVVLPYVAASQSGLLPSALRLARHVITSDSGGLVEALPLAGTDASVTVVAAGDADGLAAAIREICSSPARQPRSSQGHASRYEQGGITPAQRLASWRPFLSTLARLTTPAGLGVYSNSDTTGASERYEGLGGEALARAWYHSRRVRL
jgi:glycosyltransferase involved in cell wall biosynthesis